MPNIQDDNQTPILWIVYLKNVVEWICQNIVLTTKVTKTD